MGELSDQLYEGDSAHRGQNVPFNALCTGRDITYPYVLMSI
jgi:hypothetical protein